MLSRPGAQRMRTGVPMARKDHSRNVQERSHHWRAAPTQSHGHSQSRPIRAAQPEDQRQCFHAPGMPVLQPATSSSRECGPSHAQDRRRSWVEHIVLRIAANALVSLLGSLLRTSIQRLFSPQLQLAGCRQTVKVDMETLRLLSSGRKPHYHTCLNDMVLPDESTYSASGLPGRSTPAGRNVLQINNLAELCPR